MLHESVTGGEGYGEGQRAIYTSSQGLIFTVLRLIPRAMEQNAGNVHSGVLPQPRMFAWVCKHQSEPM